MLWSQSDDSQQRMRALKRIRTLIWDHPVLWVIVGIPLFVVLSRLPFNSWNVEILIARNILNGYGFVAAPLDPPALWRPPLTVAVLLPIQLLVHNPKSIYADFGALTLVGFLVSLFYLMRTLGGKVAAHFSQLIVLATPAFTMLVNRQLQLLSYLLLFSLVTLSILTTLWSWQRQSWRRDLLAGLCWGIAFLARPEAILLFAVSLFAGLAFFRSLGTARNRAALRFVLQLAAFLVIYEPSVRTFQALQKRYNLVGQEPLITYYAGARFAINQLEGDPDGSGYLESVQRFGGPEKYHNSLIRFMIAHPQAILVRIGQNLSNFKTAVLSRRLFNVWDCFMFLAFASILVFARPPSIPERTLLAYMTLLLMASPYFLVFHLDIRYSLLFVVILVLWISVTALVFWTWVGSRFRSSGAGKWLLVLPTIGLAVLCAIRLDTAIATARNEMVDLTPWRQLATSFRANVGPEGTPVVSFFAPDGTDNSGGDFLWFSYFARTAMPWCGDPNCDAGNIFPRGRIYSFLGKPTEYLWTTDELAPKITRPHQVIVQHVAVTNIGSYSLVKLASN